MVEMITEGIQVKVETFYQRDYSNPRQSEYMFAYQITIYNLNDFPVKLSCRHFDITDSGMQWDALDKNLHRREIDGEGVVGMQPTIPPGVSYQYVSGCIINSEIGRMSGWYEFINLRNEHTFRSLVPEFPLVVPFKLN